MSAPQAIRELVERFEQNKADYRAGKYNETQLRREFLDPLFKALGWDVDNEQGYAEAYKDVVHEATVKVGDATKAPDYSFRIGGTRKFFVEAKKPSVNIKDDIAPAFQTRRYAWSAKLPLSILTDFEEFAVYDCRIKPSKNDKASTARVMYFTYSDYLSKWDEIEAIFSRDAILKGSFDKFATSKKKKRGTAEVDDAFLEEIERWRDLLARNIALRNKNALSPRQLNEAVQLTIDRIIFLRIAEGRGVEVYGQLREIAEGEGKNPGFSEKPGLSGDESQKPGFSKKPGFLDATIYDRLKELYQKADARYNSGLFHFGVGGDEFTLGLEIDDKVLKDILSNLYYPDSPYVFSEIPSDILGQVYERFLGKVIRLTPSGQAKVEEKPEVRKAGGVYYTPTYIVDYIVENTVGALLEGKTPTSASKLKIIDPACGSGTFLLGAFEHLIQWHLNWYVQDDPSKWAKKGILLEGREGWGLTLDEKKRILQNNIFGVDIDAQAVEVTKLSLLLKVIEMPGQLGMLAERILPDLSANVKCGNSLIGSDYYNDKQMPLLGDEEFWRVNAFDWERAFPEIMSPSPLGGGARGGGAGGFDAVIGNPPYVRQEVLGSDFKTYARKKYETYAGTADLYIYFIENSHKILKRKGYFSFIVSNKWMRSNYGKSLRNFLKNESQLVEIIDFGELPVFENAATFPAIIITRKEKIKKQEFLYEPIKTLDFEFLANEIQKVGSILDERAIEGKNWTLTNAGELAVLEKIHQKGVPFGEYTKGKVNRGVVTGYNKAFIINRAKREQLITDDSHSEEIIKPFIIGNDVRHYHVNYKEQYLIFTRRGIDIDAYPAVKKYLEGFKERLKPRPKDFKGVWKGRKAGNYAWYEIQDSVDFFEDFEKNKIVYPEIQKESRFTFDEDKYFCNKTLFIIPGKDLYLLGILNSKLAWLFLKRTCSVLGDPDKGGRLLMQYTYVKELPIRTINFADPAEVKLHEEMVTLVERMLSLHGGAGGQNPGFSEKPGFSDAKGLSPREQEMRQRQIEMTDEAIDKLVYRLYGLTEEEIGIVEGE